MTTAVTQLQLGAWGGMRYGDFSGRAPTTRPIGKLLRLRHRNTTLKPDVKNVILSPKRKHTLI